MMPGVGGGPEGFPSLLHHHHHLRSVEGGVPHNQFAQQQPLHHPGLVLPPKYVSKEDYSSAKSIADSRASVYYTPHHGTEDENASQQSIQGTPIHINFMSHPLEQTTQRGKSKRSIQGDGDSIEMGFGGRWSENPERLCGGGSGHTADEEMMLMRMNLGDLDEDTTEILLHELVQKKLKRDRRNRQRFLKGARGVNGTAAEHSLIGGTAGAHTGGGGLMKVRGKSRRPVLASAMDPEFLRLLNGGAEGIPIQDRWRMQRKATDHSRYRVGASSGRMLGGMVPDEMIIDEEAILALPSGSGVQKPKKRCSGGSTEKADILYHALNGETTTVAVVEKAAMVANEDKIAAKMAPVAEDRFSQRQMFNSKSLPEISRKRGKTRENGVGGDQGESGALLKLEKLNGTTINMETANNSSNCAANNSRLCLEGESEMGNGEAKGGVNGGIVMENGLEEIK